MKPEHIQRIEGLITVEISDRRLPARMVAGRIRTDVRHLWPIAVPRARGGRGAMVILAVAAMSALSVTRIRHGS